MSDHTCNSESVMCWGLILIISFHWWVVSLRSAVYLTNFEELSLCYHCLIYIRLRYMPNLRWILPVSMHMITLFSILHLSIPAPYLLVLYAYMCNLCRRRDNLPNNCSPLLKIKIVLGYFFLSLRI